MTLVYRSTIGRRLTVSEGDGNISELSGSAGITFLPSGTGAFSTTTQEELRHLIWITQYQNDDGTQVAAVAGRDNTTGINKALAAHRIVGVPEASLPFEFSGPLKVQNGTKLPSGLVGLGWSVSQLLHTGSGTAFGPTSVGSLYCPVLKYCKLYRTAAAGSTIGIDRNYSEFAEIISTWIEGFGIGEQMGIGATSDSYFGKTEHCHFLNNTTHTKVGTGASVNGNTWRDNKRVGGTTGVDHLGGVGNRFLEEWVETMTDAYKITGNDNVIFPAFIDATVTNGVTLASGSLNNITIAPTNAGGTANGYTDNSGNRTNVCINPRGATTSFPDFKLNGQPKCKLHSVGSPGASYTPDCSLYDSFELVLDQNITIANPTNLQAGMELKFTLFQPGAGGKTVTWGGNYRVNAPIDATADHWTSVMFVADGTSFVNQIATSKQA